jgi:hypothetical protein
MKVTSKFYDTTTVFVLLEKSATKPNQTWFNLTMLISEHQREQSALDLPETVMGSLTDRLSMLDEFYNLPTFP